MPFTLADLNHFDAKAEAQAMEFSGQYEAEQNKITVVQYLNRPDLLLHRMLDISEKGFIVDALLQSGFDASGGVVPYTRSESLYLDREPQEVPEGGYYPVSGDTLPRQLEERARKYGLKTFVTEELVRRGQIPFVDRELQKLRNSMIRYLDGVFLNKMVNDPDIQRMAASAAWTPSSATIGRDIETARNMIRVLYEGYEATTLVINPEKIPALTTNTTFANAYVGQAAVQNPIFSGQIQSLYGLEVMQTPNLVNNDGTPANYALVLQRRIIGGIADEVPLQVKALPFNEDNDSYWLKGKRVSATFLTDPGAVVRINGI